MFFCSNCISKFAIYVFNFICLSVRWQKNGSFGFFSVGSCVGKKPNVPFAGRLFTLTHNGSSSKNPHQVFIQTKI